MRKYWVSGAVAAVVVLGGAGHLAVRPAGPHGPAPDAAPGAQTAAQDQAVARAAAAPQTLLADAAVQAELYPDDRILGSKDAPITMIEYASLTCPHCAAFETQVMPQLKSDYIDKGQVRFVYRDFPLDGAALQAAQLAQCATDDQRFFALVDTLFKLQHEWGLSDDVPGALAKIGALAGMDKATVDKCLADQELKAKILARRGDAETKFDVNSTPTFVINGRVLRGVQTIDMLQALFKELLPKG
ncbi:MAG: DsbA family protein [Rhodospirillaceae bacterium]|nr:DsbA family protein [Rhodospirillaceae bacterium]